MDAMLSTCLEHKFRFFSPAAASSNKCPWDKILRGRLMLYSNNQTKSEHSAIFLPLPNSTPDVIWVTLLCEDASQSALVYTAQNKS